MARVNPTNQNNSEDLGLGPNEGPMLPRGMQFGAGMETGNTYVSPMLATFTGGTGGAPTAPVRSVVTTPTTPVRPLAPVPIRNPIPREVVYTPPPPPVEPQISANISNPPPKNPQPALPSVRGIKGRVPVTINPQRYSVRADEWQVSAVGEAKSKGGKITPIRLTKPRRPELIPLLRADGIVVKIRDRYLVSVGTLADIENSNNPHYDIMENGQILKTAMGKSIPIIELNIDTLIGLGAKRDLDNAKAGVKSVAYIYETPTVYGIPEGVIDHLNYILDPKGQRTPDSFELWNLNLKGDYSIQRLTTYPLGKTTVNGVELPYRNKDNDKKVLGVVGSRMTGLRSDLNLIKGCFFRGELPPEMRRGSTPYTRLATMDPATGEVGSTAYVVKTVQPVAVANTPPKPTILPKAQVASETVGGIDPKTGAPKGLAAVKTNSSADELNRWRSYRFTKEEVAEILRDAKSSESPLIEVQSGEVMGIGAVRFGPDLCRKARVVLPLGSADVRAFEEFYGAGLTPGEYDRANRRRIAELLNLAVRITELELKSGRTLSKE